MNSTPLEQAARSLYVLQSSSCSREDSRRKLSGVMKVRPRRPPSCIPASKTKSPTLQSLRFSGIVLTLYDYLLTFNDEVEQQSLTLFASVSLYIPFIDSVRLEGSQDVEFVPPFVRSPSRELTNRPCNSLLPLYPGASQKIKFST